jgi:cell division protein FtsL
MKKIETMWLFAFFVIYIAYDRFHAYDVESKISDDVQYLAKSFITSGIDLANINQRVDSMHKQNEALAKTVLYLDSCNQIKAQKADKAERRGKFVGGLIKGLFPGI